MKSEQQEPNKADTCPVCGAHSVQACRDPEGHLLDVDHEGRPRTLPDLLALFSPRRPLTR